MSSFWSSIRALTHADNTRSAPGARRTAFSPTASGSGRGCKLVQASGSNLSLPSDISTHTALRPYAAITASSSPNRGWTNKATLALAHALLEREPAVCLDLRRRAARGADAAVGLRAPVAATRLARLRPAAVRGGDVGVHGRGLAFITAPREGRVRAAERRARVRGRRDVVHTPRGTPVATIAERPPWATADHFPSCCNELRAASDLVEHVASEERADEEPIAEPPDRRVERRDRESPQDGDVLDGSGVVGEAHDRLM